MNMSDLQRINRHAQTHDAMSTLKYIKQLTKKEDYERLTERGRIDPARGYRWDICRNTNN